MCGIFTLLNNSPELIDALTMNEQFQKGKGRGPEFSILTNVMIKVDFGFHRLAINGLNTESNQPIVIDDVALICNGEIYNYKELYEQMAFPISQTDSDCEVIIHLYLRYGMEQTLQMLDGVFSFVLVDYRLSQHESKLYVARDPYGVRPLYILKNKQLPSVETVGPITTKQKSTNQLFGFASELKMLSEFPSLLAKKKNTQDEYVIEQFAPGTFQEYNLAFTVSSSWEFKKETQYHGHGFNRMPNVSGSNVSGSNVSGMDTIIRNIQQYLIAAVNKRCDTTERPIACLLSGGLDSSLIAGLVSEYHKKHNKPPVETYSIGLEGSEDLRYAKQVAVHLGTKHTEIVLTEKDFLDAIPEVIYAIESYDTTTVRASIGNWLLGKYISTHSDAKVIFNGDGSDELAGGYLYMNLAQDSIEFDRECRRLLKDIHAFDVLRSDKSISSHGLEPRTPFLDRSWVQYYLSIPCEIRFHKESKNMEKFLIRKAFSEDYFTNSEGRSLLPDEVIWRKKEAFSDGVSKETRSLYQIIQEFAETKFEEENVQHPYVKLSPEMYETIFTYHPRFQTKSHLPPKTAEQFYYRKIFETHYSGLSSILPYFWMPKYVMNATDASARTLSIYSSAATLAEMQNTKESSESKDQA